MRRTVWLFAILLLPAVPTLAQTKAQSPAAAPAAATPGRVPVLTLPVALSPDLAAALAVQRSTDLALAAQGIATAEGYLTQAQAINSVTVTASAGIVKTGPETSFTLGTGADARTVSLSSSLSQKESIAVSVPLYLGKRDRFAREAARAGVDAAGWSVETAKLAVAQAARQAVFGLLRLQQLSVVAQQQVTAVAEHLRIANAMFEAGTAPRFEVVQAETNLAQAKGSAIQAQTAVSLIKAEIATLLNVPQGLDIPVEEGVPYQLPEGDMNQLSAIALRERPETKVLQAQVSAQEANVRLAQANSNPSVALEGTLNNQTESVAAAALNWSLSLGASWPLYQGGLTRGKVEVAQAALKSARLNLEKTSQQIALEVTQALFQIQDARQALEVADQGETNARERARIADVRFTNGVGLGVEVLDAQTALAAAQAQVINARYNLQIAVVSLRSALGLVDLPKEPAP